MRIATLGISHETNTFSVIPATYKEFEKRLINAPVAPIATRSAGIAQHTKVLLLAKRTRICVNNDFFSLSIKFFLLMKQYSQNL